MPSIVIQGLIFLLFLSSSYAQSVSTSVRVRLLKGVDQIKLTGVVTYKNKNLINPSFLYDSSKRRIIVQTPVRNYFIKSNKLELEAKTGKWNSTSLPKKINIVVDNKSLHLVGFYPLKTYLSGVLPSEMPSSWPEESLKAQAVASRTYVLYQMQKRRKHFFDVDKSVDDQVFNPQLSKGKYHDKILQVLQATEHLVLFRWQKLVPAFFHSHCGGHTEKSFHVWLGEEILRGVDDPFCKTLMWNANVSKNEVATKYIQSTGDVINATLQKIVPGPKNFSQRSSSVYLFFSDGKIRRWATQDLRQSLGYGLIKSTRFSVINKSDVIKFSGTGYGHGVGLCQHGAKAMALKKFSFQKILQHYYPGSNLDSFLVSKKLAHNRSEN